MMEQLSIKEADLFGVAEIAIRYKSTVAASKRFKINSPDEAVQAVKYAYARDEIDLDYAEAFYSIFLNRAGRVLAIELIGKGGISGTTADPKMVFQRALLVNASSVILAHNHPSGNLTPSRSDLELTKQFVGCGKFLDCGVLDHFIITSEGWYSFANENQI